MKLFINKSKLKWYLRSKVKCQIMQIKFKKVKMGISTINSYGIVLSQSLKVVIIYPIKTHSSDKKSTKHLALLILWLLNCKMHMNIKMAPVSCTISQKTPLKFCFQMMKTRSRTNLMKLFHSCPLIFISFSYCLFILISCGISSTGIRFLKDLSLLNLD